MVLLGAKDRKGFREIKESKEFKAFLESLCYGWVLFPVPQLAQRLIMHTIIKP
jgi:hypothetical protein